MADEQPPGIEPPAPDPVEVQPRRPRRRRSLKIDKDKVVEFVKDTLTQDLNDRQERIERRIERYEQLNGWLPDKDWPWENCYSLDTEILTSRGWRHIGDVEKGELVYSRSFEGEAKWRFVTATTRTWNKEAIQFSGKSIDLLVTPNHRMLIERANGQADFVPAQEFVGLSNQGWKIPLTSKCLGSDPETIYGMNPRAYVRLLGWYISEGNANYQITRYGKPSTGSFSISQSATMNAAKCEILEDDIIAAGATFKKYEHAYTLHAKSLPRLLREELRSLGKVDQKHIPEHVMYLCPQLLEQLLSTLVLGDGHTTLRGHTSYFTTSKKLADQVQIIAQRIGLRATISTRSPMGGVIRGESMCGVRIGYQVSINRKTSVQVRKLSIARINLSSPQEFACVTVPPFHTVYVRRNGKAAWCGNCANFWIPTMLIASRRMGATLENAVKSMRPVVAAKAKQKQNSGKEDGINAILDYQTFVENDGEKILDAFTTNFVNDEVAFLYIPWVREDQTVREVRILPDPLDPAVDHVAQIAMPVSGALAVMFETLENFTMADSQGWKWDVIYKTDEGKSQTATVEFFDTEDGKLEGYITKDVRTFDGPCPQVPDFEDIVFPFRSANLQPPCGANPHGAPYVHHICKTDLSTIARRMANGTYDLLTEDDFDAIKLAKSAVGSGEPEELPKEAKDKQAGDQLSMPGEDGSRQLVVSYSGWDVNDDGFEEQVIFWTIRCGGHCYLAAMRFLSEVYPGIPLMRPLISESIFPEPNRIYGRSFIDALEPIQHMSQASMNQHFDWGTLTNMPFGFYRASSGMKAEPITLEPGIMNPLDDPQRDVFFPQFAQRGETFNINTMSLLQQLSEKLSFSDIAFGRIPTGKASALRTTGTTNALMSQVDVSSERILRRLFHAICAMFQMMHRLNRRYLLDKKQIVMIGLAKQGEDPYKELTSEEIDADVDFEFMATMLNTNKEILAQILQQSLAMAATPLALQTGIVTPEEIYNLYYDLYKAQDLDPDRYAKKPAGLPPGPKLTAEDVFTMIVEGEMPVGSPAEQPQEHLQKLANMSKVPPTDVFFMAFNDQRKMMFQAWVMQVQQLAMLQLQQQMMMAGAAGGGGGNGGGGPGGVESKQDPNAGGNAPVQPGEFLDGSMGNEVPQ